jgi:predicted nucleic acid-binding protein
VPTNNVIVDTGPLIVLSDKARWFFGDSWLTAMGEEEVQGLVPPEVAVEFLRGTPDLTRAEWWLSRMTIVETGPDVARRAGRLLRSTRDSGISVVDALVVQHAISRNCGILTSDPRDLRRLRDISGVDIDIFELPWPA